ncbi:hypothetical protein PR202_ga06900 [Eleusine coracana subsp. coracana]|uniref:Leucine-rich repeat-containing N-terminal plant-type domain-containing protein n=1 Tax=Eleusine coracana subsp. coracana TaxID=191504 RepID=A0AAV5BW82_ELECO|nr:hypothetical protein PR202_ga06900 [Eleusine coracana subsp. coracana]
MELFLNFLLFITIIPLCNLVSGSQAATNSSDHLALLSFKSLITADPSGVLKSWRNTSTVGYCQWHGVTCGARGQRRGLVTALQLPGLNISGIISPKIANLTFLMRLDLSKNQLHGTAPHELSLLLNLNHLDLSFNTLNGKIPPSLSHCSNLRNISLGFNSLQGEIPEEFGSLVDLQSLSLLHNNLTGTIPANSFQNLQKLELLSLAGNKLSGEIPHSLGNLTSLTYLLLNNNSFTGVIPPSLSKLSSLTKLGLVGNNLTGVIPPALGNLSNLLWLDIGYNYLTARATEGFSHTNLIGNGSFGSVYKGIIPYDGKANSVAIKSALDSFQREGAGALHMNHSNSKMIISVGTYPRRGEEGGGGGGGLGQDNSHQDTHWEERCCCSVRKKVLAERGGLDRIPVTSTAAGPSGLQPSVRHPGSGGTEGDEISWARSKGLDPINGGRCGFTRNLVGRGGS